MYVQVLPAPAPSEVMATVAGIRAWLVGRAQGGSGALYSWIDAVSGQPAFEYPEITGYALTHFAAQTACSDAEIAAGLSAGRWLCRLIDSDGLAARRNWDGHAIYNFDLGMISNGLLTFGSRLNQSNFVAAGLHVATGLRDQVRRYGWLESIDLASSPASTRSAWSTDGHVHLVKVAQCLLTADRLGLSGGAEAATQIIGRGLLELEPDGRFVTHSRECETMLHPHLYAVEGLSVHAFATGSASSAAAAQAATDWVWRHQLPTGGFPRYVATGTRAGEPEQFDTTAQAVRAAMLCGLRPVGLGAAVERLCAQAVATPAGCALPYRPDTAVVHENTWVSMFAAQALASFCATDGVPFHWSHLV
jgi:hypothetical protein